MFNLPHKKWFLILLAGIICWFFILPNFTEHRKSSMEDVVETINLCVRYCANPTIQTDVKPNYKLPPKFSESTCSKKATSRGQNQRVITYSFYGNIDHSRSYFQGIERNVVLMQQLYPGWVMRVYHNVKEPWARHLLCQMQCNHWDVLDTCFAENLPGYGNISGSQGNAWRFLAVSDPLVDTVLSRDLDSSLNKRELAAVQEWLLSNASLHVMRDSRFHIDLMLAGMWGARMNENNRAEWRETMERILLRGKLSGGHGMDQVFLAEEVWNKHPDWVLQHDSYFCEKFKTTGKMLSFPTKRLNGSMNFVGSRYNVDTGPDLFECPVACRRQPDWKNC